MKDREQHIEFHRNYCVHYHPQTGGKETICRAGMDISKIQRFNHAPGGIKWGPCIGGHNLENVCDYCPKWKRRSLESAEKYADDVKDAMDRMTKASPVISAWRKKEPIGKQKFIICPVCAGQLHLEQSSYNGHFRARCETDDCINFIE